MTEIDKDKLKDALISTSIKLLDITTSFDDLNNIQEIEKGMQEKINACLGMLKAVLELMAFHHGEITGNELRNESNLPAQ